MTAPATSGMTVGVDARKIRDFGIGRYLEGLLSGLADVDGDDRFVLFLPTDPERSLPEHLNRRLNADRFPRVPCEAKLYSVREQFAFVGAAGRHGLDVLHFPHYVRTLSPGCPAVVSIHDAIHLSYPPSVFASVYARLMMPWSGLSAARLLAGTDAARDDICRRLRVVRPERFSVTPYGLDARFRAPAAEDVQRFRDERGLNRPFVLCIGSHRPHKNLPAAVAGFTQAALPDSEFIVPARDRDAEQALGPIVQGSGTRLLAGVDDHEMPLLYAAARVVLCPSRAEGFGFAPLEAAGCGTAVVASDIPPHREVMGTAARYVPAPHDAPAIAAAITPLWADEGQRRELAMQGVARAREFTWKRTAELTLDVYRQAAGRPPRSSGSLL